jgi:tRNA nucleotidyltransferase/poly(A) polymerase
MQESAIKMSAVRIADHLDFLENHHDKKEHRKEIEALDKLSAERKAEMMKGCGVKTPLELVRHIAEYETNMHGATVSIEGDDSVATLFNEKPTVWLEAKKLVKMNKEQEEKMHHHYKTWMHDLANAFGFKVKVELCPDSSKITFSLK